MIIYFSPVACGWMWWVIVVVCGWGGLLWLCVGGVGYCGCVWVGWVIVVVCGL